MRIARNFSSFCFELSLEIAEDAFLIPPRIRFRCLIRNHFEFLVLKCGGGVGQLGHLDDLNPYEVPNVRFHRGIVHPPRGSYGAVRRAAAEAPPMST